jgi:type IV secretory pathway VirJ component
MRRRRARVPTWLAALALSATVSAPAQPALAATGVTSSASATSAAETGETLTFAPFGTVHVYAPAGAPSQVVLFISGDGGWNLGVIPMARRLQSEGALVVGIDIRTFLASLERSGACAYPAGSLEELSRAAQLRHRLPEYHTPILVGYSSGATLVYAALAQAPPETFRGAISLGFCPDVSLQTPLCRGRGLVSRPKAKGTGRDLDPFKEMGVPWTVLHGDVDQVCAPATAAEFVGRVDSGRIVPLPKVGHGFSVTSRWEPQYVEAYHQLAEETAASIPSPPSAVAPPAATDDLGDLGLVEVPATGREHDLMAVVLTGDGGWAEIDKRVAARLAEGGIPVIGWSSLRYYWTPRTQEAASHDLARILEGFGRAWGKHRFLLAGYSFGADVLPFLVSRLPAHLRARVALVGLLGLSEQASFEFHVAGWLGVEKGHHPTAPEVARLEATPVLCLQGEDEADSACRLLRGAAVRTLTLPGGHHFGGDYGRIAEALLAELATGHSSSTSAASSSPPTERATRTRSPHRSAGSTSPKA